jgi:hypothetical protein
MIALDPNFAKGYSTAGMMMLYAGQPEKAIEKIGISVRLDPHYSPMVLQVSPRAHRARLFQPSEMAVQAASSMRLESVPGVRRFRDAFDRLTRNSVP